MEGKGKKREDVNRKEGGKEGKKEGRNKRNRYSGQKGKKQGRIEEE